MKSFLMLFSLDMKLLSLLSLGLGVFGEEAKDAKKGASWDNLDYKIIYIEDPKKVLKRERDPNQPINKESHSNSF